jgi:hypothetical protein
MKTRRRTAVLGGVVLVLLVANIAFAHDWWFWHQHKRTLGIFITAVNATSAEAARADWGAGFNVMNLPRVTHHSDVSVLDGNFGDTGWGGLAEVITYFQHCHFFGALGTCDQSFPGITHAHVRLNTFYAWPNLNSGTVLDAGRGVFCQEIGHAFGLDHSPDGCMGKGYFAGLLDNQPISNVVTSHSDNDLNAKYGGAPFGDCDGGCF